MWITREKTGWWVGGGNKIDVGLKFQEFALNDFLAFFGQTYFEILRKLLQFLPRLVLVRHAGGQYVYIYIYMDYPFLTRIRLFFGSG